MSVTSVRPRRDSLVCRGCRMSKARHFTPDGGTYVLVKGEFAKIGVSSDPGRRIREYETAVTPNVAVPAGLDWSEDIRLCWVMPGDYEHQFHELLAARWAGRGEWFHYQGPLRQFLIESADQWYRWWGKP